VKSRDKTCCADSLKDGCARRQIGVQNGAGEEDDDEAVNSSFGGQTPN